MKLTSDRNRVSQQPARRGMMKPEDQPLCYEVCLYGHFNPYYPGHRIVSYEANYV